MASTSSASGSASQFQPSVSYGNLLFRAWSWLRVDRAIAYGVLLRVWSMATSPFTLLLIATFFTPALQGYYYTFRNLVAFQVFVELGLGQVILQFASHEWVRLRFNQQGEVEGESHALSRLVDIGRFAIKWYAIAGVALAIILGMGGFIFFIHSPYHGIRWAAPWLALCVLSGADLCEVPLWSLLQGCNQVAPVNGFLLAQGVLRTLTMWAAMAMGAGLWTPAVGTGISLMWAAAFLYCRYRGFLHSLRRPPAGARMDWKAEMLPFQWRIAVSWLSGYFMFSLFTPVLFKFRGPIVAGQMGMTWALIGALSMISMTWVYTKAPSYGMLVAERKFSELDRLAVRTGAAALAVALLGAAAIESGVVALNHIAQHFSARLLPPLPTAIFLLATVLMQVSNPQSVYLRAHKKEPFLWLSLLSGMAIAATTLLLGRRYGATGMAAGYLAVVALLDLPIGTWILFRCRAAWHVAPASPVSPTKLNPA